jgi:hypothetical protein
MHARVHRGQWAVDRFGELATRSFAALERSDPIADQLVEWLATPPQRFALLAAWQAAQAGEPAPEPISALFDSIRDVPTW